MSIAESIAQRVQTMVRDAGAEEAPAADADSASEAESGSPPTAEASGTESASADESTSGASSGSPPDAGSSSPEAPNDRHALLQEKLDAIREQRAAARLEAEAKRLREEAEADRKAAAEERAKLEARKKKPWLERIKEDGENPADVFEAMRVEALKAGTPEAKIEALEAAHQAELAAIRDEFKAFRESLEAEKTAAEEARRQAEAEAEARVFDSHFQTALGLPQFASLAEEYEPETLYGIVAGLKENPDRLLAQARALRVNLTAPGGRFNMGDIFAVLKATQDAHRAKLAARNPPQEQAPQAKGESKTVNGTTDRRNAGSALGNDLATARATDTKPRTTRAERVRKLIVGG
jgi:hypothetical protein